MSANPSRAEVIDNLSNLSVCFGLGTCVVCNHAPLLPEAREVERSTERHARGLTAILQKAFPTRSSVRIDPEEDLVPYHQEPGGRLVADKPAQIARFHDGEPGPAGRDETPPFGSQPLRDGSSPAAVEPVVVSVYRSYSDATGRLFGESDQSLIDVASCGRCPFRWVVAEGNLNSLVCPICAHFRFNSRVLEIVDEVRERISNLAVAQIA